MAPEVCNNAVVGGAQIPMLTLGIPGSAPAAVMLGALMTHGLKPGFDLFSEQGDIVFTYTFGLILSNFIILLLGLVLVRIFVRALKIPQHFLVVAILALSVVGSYSISSSLMDVLSMAACGLLGYVLVRYKYGVAPMALGLILGTTMEEGFKLSLHLGAAEGNIMLFFFSRPAEPCAYHPYAAFARVFHLEGMRGQEGLIFGTYRLLLQQWRIRLNKKMLGCGAAHQEGCR